MPIDPTSLGLSSPGLPAAGVLPLPNPAEGGGGAVGGGNDVMSNVPPVTPDASAKPADLTPSPDDDLVLGALIKRGSKPRRSIELDDDESRALCEKVVRDFNDGAAACQERYKQQIELVKNWEGIVDPKSFPFADSANIRVPFTSVQVQDWSARLTKAILGGDQVTRFEALDKIIDKVALDEMGVWFQWELDEVVEFRQAMERIIQHALIGGTVLPIPCWKKERRELMDYQEFDFDPARPIAGQLDTAIEQLFEGREATVESQKRAGVFRLSVKDPDEPTPDDATVTFSIANNRLCANVTKVETTFHGVKIEIPNDEDVVLINTNPDIEKLPYVGLRIWLSVADWRNGMADGTWYDLGDERNRQILATTTAKVPEIVPIDYTKLQDVEEGTDSTDAQSWEYDRRFIEVYRWEGWWHRKLDVEDQERALSPAVQVCAYVVPRAREIIKIDRLEALNKDGKRSPVPFGFIERANRFFRIALTEWVRHVQAELDGIHNLRLDAGTFIVMPFGFYKPLAGMQKDVFDIVPGKMFPVADPSSVNFPRMNSNPTWSFQDEATVKKYGGEQSGLGQTAAGGFISKRQSATEAAAQANSIDLRTEMVVIGFLRSLRKLLYRVLGLYQQFAPPTRIFQVGGDEGLRLVKKFETDRLHGRLLLRLTGNVDQINPQLQRDIATNMLSLLLNEILIQLGIVKPQTIYEAIKQVAKTMNYKDVTLFAPQMPEQSPEPNIENRKMAMGEPVEPHLDEPFDAHLKSHLAFMVDPRAKSVLTPKTLQLLLDHIQKTQKMQQVAAYLAQQQALQAGLMKKQMASMGVRPGQDGGQSAGDNLGPGTEAEGVQGASEAA